MKIEMFATYSKGKKGAKECTRKGRRKALTQQGVKPLLKELVSSEIPKKCIST